jgi:tetratricopeptide (TPR) repeat protein
VRWSTLRKVNVRLSGIRTLCQIRVDRLLTAARQPTSHIEKMNLDPRQLAFLPQELHPNGDSDRYPALTAHPHAKGDLGQAQAGAGPRALATAALSNRGNTFNAKVRYDRAIEAFDYAIKLNQHNASGFNNQGASRFGKGEYDRAIEDSDQAIKLDPNYAPTFIGRGAAYGNQGRYDRAIEDYNRAIQLKPNYAEAFYRRGIAYFERGEYDRAIHDFDQVIKHNPNYSDALKSRGAAYAKQSQYGRAIQDFNEAIKLQTETLAKTVPSS